MIFAFKGIINKLQKDLQVIGEQREIENDYKIDSHDVEVKNIQILCCFSFRVFF